MKIEFISVDIEGFLSIDKARVDLRNKGFTLIKGINNNTSDNASSNGSGKSALLGSVVWALTGETIRGTKDVVNKFTNTGTCVSLDFIIDDTNYRVVRYKDFGTIGTDLKLYVNGVDKSGKGIRDTSKILSDYLPDLTTELLGSVIILGQGLPQRFTNNTPSGRKEILEKLSKSDFMITDIKDRLSSRKNELNSSLRAVEDSLLSDESKKSVLENNLKKLREDKLLLNNAPNYAEEIEKYEEQLNLLSADKNKFSNICEELHKQIDTKLKEYQDWTSKVGSNYNHECQLLDEQYNVFNLQTDLNKLKATIDTKEDSIIKLESVKDICPTCGQKLPNVHKVDTTQQRAELEELKSKYKDDSKYLDGLSSDLQDKKKSILDRLNKTSEEIKQQGTCLREEFNKNNSTLQQCDKEINNINLTIEKIKLNKENYEKQSRTIDEDIDRVEKEISSLSEKILYNNLDKDIKNRHLDIVNKMITIATRDFRGYLLSGIIDYINLKSKEYCRDIFNTDSIEFKLDGNSIFIGYCGKAYENLSGGEKQKIDLIVQFSIRDMLSQFLDFRSNIICLDEVFDNLDNIGCQNVLNLISNKLNDIESIFIITHHSDIDIPTDNEIIMIKNSNGVSEIA